MCTTTISVVKYNSQTTGQANYGNVDDDDEDENNIKYQYQCMVAAYSSSYLSLEISMYTFFFHYNSLLFKCYLQC